MKTPTQNPKAPTTHRRNASHTPRKSGGDVAFADHRPEAVAHERTQRIADNSPQAREIAQLQSIADSGGQQSEVIQLKWVNDADNYTWDNPIDGVEWKTDGHKLWFVIVDEAAIKMGKLSDYQHLQGERKEWKEWNAISIMPLPEDTIYHPTVEAFDGWASETGIDWEAIDGNRLTELQRHAVNLGIKPLMEDLLGNLPEESLIPLRERMENAMGKMLIFPKEEFALRSCHFSATDTEDGLAAVGGTANSATLPLDTIKSDLSTKRELGNDLGFVLDMFGGIQGQAMGGYQCINAGSAFKQQGLHLVIHETMHNLADPGFVEELRQNELGDEGLNEYFARLATLVLTRTPDKPDGLASLIGSPKGGISGDIAKGTKAEHGRGVYGDLMNAEGFHPIARGMDKEALINLAKKYFLNMG